MKTILGIILLNITINYCRSDNIFYQLATSIQEPDVIEFDYFLRVGGYFETYFKKNDEHYFVISNFVHHEDNKTKIIAKITINDNLIGVIDFNYIENNAVACDYLHFLEMCYDNIIKKNPTYLCDEVTLIGLEYTIKAFRKNNPDCLDKKSENTECSPK